MEKNIIKIKKSRFYTPVLLIFSVILLALSIYCIIYPSGKALSQSVALTFRIAGGAGAAYFAFSFFNYFFQLISPKNALVISDDGFADFVTGGTGVGFVEWKNVCSVTPVKTKNGSYLGIGLVDTDALELNPKGAAFRALNQNKENNLPEIIISSSDIDMRISELNRLFSKYTQLPSDYDDTFKTRIINAVSAETESKAQEENKSPASAEGTMQFTVPQTEKDGQKEMSRLLDELAEVLKTNRTKLDDIKEPDSSESDKLKAELDDLITKLSQSNQTEK